jgi:plastocyanin
MFARRLPFVSVVGVFFALVGLGLAHAQSAITMTASEFAFQPTTVTAAPGTVTFNLQNGGQFPHNIQIDGMANSVFADNLTSGQSASATVTLAPGTYTFWCPVSNHRERGMEGTLTVAGASAARAGGVDPLALSAMLGTVGAVVLGAGLVRRRGTV